MIDRIICFVNTTEDPPVERLLVPDMALTAAEYFAVGVGVDNKEARLLHLEVGIEACQQEISSFLFMLGVEGHCGRVIGGCVILGVIITIDTHLRFNNIATGEQRSMGNLVIIELKRDGNQPSPILDKLCDLRIHPHGFSKYCIGSALTNSSLRRNRIKPRLRSIQKILSNQS